MLTCTNAMQITSQVQHGRATGGETAASLQCRSLADALTLATIITAPGWKREAESTTTAAVQTTTRTVQWATQAWVPGPPPDGTTLYVSHRHSVHLRTRDGVTMIGVPRRRANLLGTPSVVSISKSVAKVPYNYILLADVRNSDGVPYT